VREFNFVWLDTEIEKSFSKLFDSILYALPLAERGGNSQVDQKVMRTKACQTKTMMRRMINIMITIMGVLIRRIYAKMTMRICVYSSYHHTHFIPNDVYRAGMIMEFEYLRCWRERTASA
jgi:hypothetical protein